jgi:hypothetical protein
MNKHMPDYNDFDWHLNPFSGPRTISENWDLSELLSAVSPTGGRPNPNDRKMISEEPDQTGEGAAGDPSGLAFDPFPEPGTFPSQWDLTELL